MLISKLTSQQIITSGSYNLAQGNSNAFVMCFQYAFDASTPPTYNGVALTYYGQVESQSGNRVFLWLLYNPPTGSHTFVPNGYNACAVYSFSNVNLSNWLDNYNTESGASGNDIYISGTPTVNGGYIALVYGGNSGNAYGSATSGQTDVLLLGISAFMLHTSPGAGNGATYHTQWANYTGGFYNWFFSLNPLLPVVTSLSPNTGLPTGGTAITITGQNFDSGSLVLFGSSFATSVVVVNSTTITCVTPANSVGQYTVTVTANSQSGSLSNGFTYANPSGGLLMVSD